MGCMHAVDDGRTSGPRKGALVVQLLLHPGEQQAHVLPGRDLSFVDRSKCVSNKQAFDPQESSERVWVAYLGGRLVRLVVRPQVLVLRAGVHHLFY